MKTKRSRSQIIYEVALGGISSAMALLLVWLSVIARYGTISFYILASLAILMPLTQRYYIATISAYVVSSLLAFAIVGDIFIIAGYVVYFAPMSIISTVMLEKKVKLYISIPVKVVFIGLALAFLYYVAGTIMVAKVVVGEVPFWAVEVVGIVVLLLVDFLMGYVYQALKKRVSKVIKSMDKSHVEDDEEVVDDNPFEDVLEGVENTMTEEEDKTEEN